MDLATAKAGLKKVTPLMLSETPFVKAYNTDVIMSSRNNHLFACLWSYRRGYRYNYKRTCPVLYLSCDQLTASVEIGPRTRTDILGPYCPPKDPYLYIGVKVTASVADLTDPAVRSKIGVRLRELMVPTQQWDGGMSAGRWAVTHHLGKLILGDGRFGGILYPSYPAYSIGLKQKVCLAIFMDKHATEMAIPKDPSTRLQVIDSFDFLNSAGLIF